jgi:adenylosuccinate lyase
VNEAVLSSDLERAWEVLGEAVQTVMRKHALPNPYEQLKALTRGEAITAEKIKMFVEGLDLPEYEKQRLRVMTPGDYVGIAPSLLRHIKE